MASAELSRRVEKVVGYPPLCEMGEGQRREFHEALLEAHDFEDLPGKRQAAIVAAEQNRPNLRVVPVRDGLELSRRPEQRGQDHRGQPDHQPDDPAGHVLAHENRAQGYRDPNDSAGSDHPHGAALDFGAAPLPAGHHALRAAPRLALALASLTLGRWGTLAGL
jgi:hypothetical protein